MQARFKLITPYTKWDILRVIRVEGGEFRPFNGFISYKRPFNSQLNADEFDNVFLEEIKKTFPKSEFHFANHLYHEGMENELIKTIKLSEPVTLTVSIMPDITVEDFQKLNVTYLPIREVAVNFYGAKDNDEVRSGMIKDYFNCRVPYQLVDELSNNVFAN